MHPKLTAMSLKLPELRDKPETSSTLRSYLDESLFRDPVDVLNEIEVLAELLSAEHLKTDEGKLSSQSS